VLERVQNNGKHLLALINDVLDLAKIEAGQLVLSFADYSTMRELVVVERRHRGAGAEQGSRSTSSSAPGLPTGPRRRAADHAGAAEPRRQRHQVHRSGVGVDARCGRGRPISWPSADTGPGIAAGDQEQDLRRVSAGRQLERRATKGGTGLGLAISKRIVELQGGRIWVESSRAAGLDLPFVLPIRVEDLSEDWPANGGSA
jgi:signal transduction histidine kinase